MGLDTNLASIYFLMDKIEEFNIAGLEERIFFQKAIYLIQVLGVDLRFRYSWYAHGPYCSDLAQCGFDIQDDIEEYEREFKDKSIRNDVKIKVDILKGLLSNYPTSFISKSSWLELLSSIHYIKHIIYMKSDEETTRENIFEKLKELGKIDQRSYSEEQVDIGWNKLKEIGLIDIQQIPL